MHVLVGRLIAINDPTTVRERLALTAELEGLAAELGNAERQFQATVHRAGALLEAGDGEGAEQALARLERLAAELRQPSYSWWGPVGRAMWSILRGLPTAEQDAEAALAAGTASGMPDAPTAFAVHLVAIRWDQGRAEELLDAYRSYVQAQAHIAAWRAGFACVLCEADRPEEAREQLDWLRARDFAIPSTGPGAPACWISRRRATLSGIVTRRPSCTRAWPGWRSRWQCWPSWS